MATKKHGSKSGKAQPRKKHTKPAAPNRPGQLAHDAALPAEQVADPVPQAADVAAVEPTEPVSAHAAERPDGTPAAQDVAAGGAPQADEQALPPAGEQTLAFQIELPQAEQPPTAKAKKPPRKGKAKGKAATAAGKKLSALDAAAKVLAETGQAMTCKELIGAMAAQGYWSSPAGKTPDATLFSAILRELATKGDAARFTKAGPGRFAARGAA